MPRLPQGVEALPEEVAQRPQRHVGVDEKAQKVRKRRHGHAVGRPGAVVVHLGDASLAVPAVVRPWRLRRLALFTPPPIRIEHLFLKDEPSGIDGDGAKVAEPQAQQQRVEDDALVASQRARVERLVAEDELRKVAEEGGQHADGGHGEGLGKWRIAESCHGGGCGGEDEARDTGFMAV